MKYCFFSWNVFFFCKIQCFDIIFAILTCPIDMQRVIVAADVAF